jgi:methyl-accepting chemotaxis protein
MLKNMSSLISDDLSKISSQIENFNKLDLSQKIENSSGEIEKALNHLADIVSAMLLDNRNNGLVLQDSSNSLLSNVDSLNISSNEAAASLEETAAAVEEVNSNITQSSSSIVQMTEYANELKNSANSGEELANQNTLSMDEINEQVNAINESINIIDQIAFQTNILSLNAAVEAATAGEAGKGFAVVAGEVRNLASRSAEAANEIKQLVENATNKADQGKKIADKMIDGYNSLNDNIAQTLEVISSVNQYATEQKSSITQINNAISNLDKQPQQNANIANETKSIAVETQTIASQIVQKADEKKFVGKNS